MSLLHISQRYLKDYLGIIPGIRVVVLYARTDYLLYRLRGDCLRVKGTLSSDYSPSRQPRGDYLLLRGTM